MSQTATLNSVRLMTVISLIMSALLQPGSQTTNTREFVTYHRGSNTSWPPLVLSAPHGGPLRPSSIPDRNTGCWDRTARQCIWSHNCGVKDASRCKAVTDNDYATASLTMKVRDNLCELFNGRCPAVVLNNLMRIKFDANREKTAATFGVAVVEAAFETYNEYIEDAKNVIIRRHGIGLLIDFHGHGHTLDRAELGYLYTESDLDSRSNLNPNSSSIRSLASRRTRSAAEYDNLLRGNNSFGAFLERHDFQAVPSPTNRGPGRGNPYFDGGYTTRRHGSIDGGTIDAIQIESSRRSRNPSTINRYARALACTIHQYVCLHYRSPASLSMTSSESNVIETDCSRSCHVTTTRNSSRRNSASG